MSYATAPLRRAVRALADRTRDLGPIVGVVAFFQLVVLGQPIPELGQVIGGALLVLVGLALFVEGLTLGLFPIGEALAYPFARRGSLFRLLTFSFALGFGTTVAEPALIAVAEEAATAAAEGDLIAGDAGSRADYANGLRYTVALSVGFAIALGVIRIIKGWPAQRLISEWRRRTQR